MSSKGKRSAPAKEASSAPALVPAGASRKSHKASKEAQAGQIEAVAAVPIWKQKYTPEAMANYFIPTELAYKTDMKETCAYIFPSADDAEFKARFTCPPGVLVYNHLGGLGRRGYKQTQDSTKNTWEITLQFGRVQASVAKAFPQLVADHREFMNDMKAFRDYILRHMLGDSTTRPAWKRERFTKAEEDFNLKLHRLWPKKELLSSKNDVVRALVASGMTSAKASELADKSNAWSEDKKADKPVVELIARMFEVVKDAEIEKRKEIIVEQVWDEFAPFATGFPKFQVDETTGEEYMTLRLSESISFEPRRKDLIKKIGPALPPTGDSNLDTYNFFYGPQSPLVVKDIIYKDPKGNRLFEDACRENPLLQPLGRGNLVSVNWTVMVQSGKPDSAGMYTGAGATVGVRFEPDFRSVVLHAQPPESETRDLLPSSSAPVDDYGMGDSSTFHVASQVKREMVPYDNYNAVPPPPPTDAMGNPYDGGSQSFGF